MSVIENLRCHFLSNFSKHVRFYAIVALLIVALVFANNLSAQEFGGNPSSVKWHQINSDTARIIYPTGLDETAKRVASIVHELQKNHTSTIGNRLRKVNIVLQNLPTITNGYVALGPFRSEYYLTAPQNSFELGAQSWADNLAVHEFRHVQQYNNFNVGLSKVAGILFGQEARGLANAAAIPDWFFEGDAVFNETSLTMQGRGRVPNFFNGYQSLFGEGKRYSYMKLRNGSYKNYVPGHYELGYMLVAYGREKYGADFWRKVTSDAAAFKPLFYPLQGAVKKYAGINYNQFVADAMKFYNDKWQLAKGPSPEYLILVHKNNVTDYKYPYLSEDGSLIVLKRSYKKVPAIYKILPNGSEVKIAVRTITNDDYFSYNNGKIVFASNKPDARWGYRQFSDITLVDAATGESKNITHHQRYFSPDISHDGSKVVAVDMRTNLTSIIIVTGLQGETLFRSTAMRGLVYTYPKFSANDQFIYSAVRNEEGNMALVKLELSTGKETRLIPFHNRIIGFPTVQGDTILFTSSYRGSDETWAYIESKSQIYRVAVNPTGFYQAIFQRQQNRLVASNFTADGYRLAALPASSLLWQPVGEKENALPDLYVPNALAQENKNTLQNVLPRNFATAKYHKSYNLFNFHSLRPDYSNPEFSLTLFGENILNTLQSEISYTYNRNDQSNRIGADAIYGGWYVQPTLGVNQTWTANAITDKDSALHYNTTNAHIGLRLPLNLSGGKMYRFLTLSTTLNNDWYHPAGLLKNRYKELTFNSWDGRLVYSSQIQKAVQQIYPHFAQTLSLQYRSIINKYTANQLLLSGSLYLPGFLNSHSIVLTAAYFARDTVNPGFFSNPFPFSRGYTAVNFPRMWKVSGNYHLPLFYPDWGFGNIAYFQRVRANGFYDYTQVKSLRTGATLPFGSAGGELFFDTKWWNQQVITFGVRYSRLLDAEYRRATNPNQWELILPVSLFQ